MDIIRKIILVLLLASPAALLAEDTININTADKATLTSIKGVGEKRAEAIIEYRNEYGPFESVDELASVSGVGQSTVDTNRDILSVSDGE
ncbi:MAG TPA: ComEA family DNA-binding protein [Gammaproteobacteria bacterium]|nr:ComEA family DNA-binding protein [Gammaproteobacteria bacterium]